MRGPVAALVALVTLAAAIAWWTIRDPGRPPPDAGPGRAAPSTPPGSGADGSGPSEADEPERGPVSIEGIVLRDGCPTPASIEIRRSPSTDVLTHPVLPHLRPPSGFPLHTPRVEGAPMLVARTAADGRFEITGLPLARLEVLARAADGALGIRGVRPRPERPHRRIEVEIAGGAFALEGRARFADGRPFRGVVWTSSQPAEFVTGTIRQTRASDAGAFRLDGLQEGRHVLSFQDAGLRIDVADIEVPSDGEILVVLDEGFREVTGRVVAADDDTPIAGAAVWFTGYGRPRISGRASADEDGRFVVRFPAGRGSVQVRAPGFVPALEGIPETSEEVLVSLERLGRLRGRVVTFDDSAAVPGVTVHHRRDLRYFSFQRKTVSGADGRFEIDDIAPGPGEVRAHGGGWVSDWVTARTSLDLPRPPFDVEPGATAEVEVRVVRTGRLEGRVRDASGAAVAGASVQGGTPEQWDGYRARAETVTDGEGRFALEDLVPGLPCQLTVRSPAHPTHGKGPFEIRSGETARAEIVLPPTRWIDVVVRTAEAGEPIPGARIQARGSAPALDHESWITGPDGGVRVGPLPAEAIRLRADHPGHLLETRETPVPDGTDRVALELGAGHVITGRVTVAGTLPQGSWLIVVARPAEPGRRGATGSATVLRDGTFRIERLPAGAYEVQVTHFHLSDRSEPLATRRVEAGAHVEFAVTAPAEPARSGPQMVLVRLLGPDGRPVRSARLDYRHDGGGGSGHRCENGECRLFFMGAVGPLRLEVRNARDADGERLGAYRAGPLELSGGELVLRLPESRSVSGRVLGPGGEPLGGVVVRAVPFQPGFDNALDPDRRHATARAETDGRFRLEGLGDIPYRLLVEVPAGYVVPPPLPVEVGRSDVVVELRRGVTARVRVRDEAGSPVPAARVQVSRDRRTILSAPADDRGTLEVRGLDPDAVYGLSAWRPENRDDLGSARIGNWSPADVTLTLPTQGEVHGRILGPDGGPLSDAWVWVAAPDGRWYRTAEIEADGRFRAYQVTTPTVALRATPIGGRPEEGREVVAKRGARDVVLRVDPGLLLTVRFTNRPPPGGATAELVPEDGAGESRRGLRLRPAGFRFGGLLAGTTYRLRVVDPGGLALERGGIDASARTLDVRLETGRVLRGRLLLPDGALRRGLRATAGALTVRGVVDEKGRFEIRGLLPGSWTLSAWARTEDSSWSGEVEVEAGSEEVEIGLVPKPR